MVYYIIDSYNTCSLMQFKMHSSGKIMCRNWNKVHFTILMKFYSFSSLDCFYLTKVQCVALCGFYHILVGWSVRRDWFLYKQWLLFNDFAFFRVFEFLMQSLNEWASICIISMKLERKRLKFGMGLMILYSFFFRK